MIKPYYSTKLGDLYLGSCEDILPKLEQVDLTVTSPPYGNLRTYCGYTFNFETIAKELYRITKDGGVIVWVVGDETINGSESGESFRQALYFKEIEFNLHDTMIYYRWSGPLGHNRYEQEFEYMFVFSKGKPKSFNPIMVDCSWYGVDSDRTGQKYIIHNEKNRKLRSGKNRNNIKPKRTQGNIWKINNSSQSGERHGHPAPFPEALAQDHILSWSNVGDTVLDPMSGSGTVAKMCEKLNRRWLACEVSEKYAEIAAKRIESEASQLKLFT